jgi:hypothetical protein
MSNGVVNSILLFGAVFLTFLYGQPFTARNALYRNWRDAYTTFCDFAYGTMGLLIIGAAILLAIAFKWWVPVILLFLGTRGAIACARRVEPLILLMLGKYFLLTGFALNAIAISRLILQLWGK